MISDQNIKFTREGNRILFGKREPKSGWRVESKKRPKNKRCMTNLHQQRSRSELGEWDILEWPTKMRVGSEVDGGHEIRALDEDVVSRGRVEINDCIGEPTGCP